MINCCSMPDQTTREAQIAIKKLNGMLLSLDLKTRRKVLRKAAKPMVAAARANAPISSGPHFRYGSSGKLSAGIRAPKGQGKKIAKYVPGNLKNSIRVLTFRRDRSGVYVGPKLAKRRSGFKTYGTSRVTVDAFYAHMVEFGTRHQPARGYMRKAFSQTSTLVIKNVEAGLKRELAKFQLKNQV